MSPVTHEFSGVEGERLDKFLAGHLPHFSRSRIQRLIEEGHVSVHSEQVTSPKYVLKEREEVRFAEPEPDPDFPAAENHPLEIIFEDEHLMVVNKPAGMVTHPNTFHDQGTLVQAILGMRPEVATAIYDPSNAVSRLRPGIVHRLDRDTSGLIIVAKTRPALLNLAEQFHKRTVTKTYETILYGRLGEERTVNAPIHRKGGSSSSIMVASHDPGQGRTAITHFKPVQTWAPYQKWPEEVVTRVEARIETGRTHQIRVHAKFIGHPVLGDQLYGNKPSQKLSEKLGLEAQLLRAVAISFHHPVTGKVMGFSLAANPLLPAAGGLQT